VLDIGQCSKVRPYAAIEDAGLEILDDFMAAKDRQTTTSVAQDHIVEQKRNGFDMIQMGVSEENVCDLTLGITV
jgi:hypothetical protein